MRGAVSASVRLPGVLLSLLGHKSGCLPGRAPRPQSKGPNKRHRAFMARSEAALLCGFEMRALRPRALSVLVRVLDAGLHPRAGDGEDSSEAEDGAVG